MPPAGNAGFQQQQQRQGRQQQQGVKGKGGRAPPYRGSEATRLDRAILLEESDQFLGLCFVGQIPDKDGPFVLLFLCFLLFLSERPWLALFLPGCILVVDPALAVR